MSSASAPAVLIKLHRGETAPQSPVEHAAFFGLMLLLIFGPLAFGAVESWAIFTQQVLAAGLAILWTSAWMRNPAIHFHPNPLYPPWLAIAAVALLQLLWRVPPYLHPFMLAAMSGVGYFLIFFLANQSFRFPENVRAAARVLTIFGVLLAAYSTLQAFIAPGKLLGFRVPRIAYSSFGPYVNHAHYAGLMELLIPFPLVLAFRRNLSRWKIALNAIAAVIMAASVFLSESRGGMLAMAAEFAIIVALWLRSTRRGRRLWLIPAIGLFAIFVLWLGAGELQQRLSTFRHPGVSIATRLEIAKDAIRMSAARPWLGWGLGEFPVVYPQFRSFYSNQVVGAAHNDFLQALAELGIAGAAVLLGFLLALYLSAKRHLARWHLDSVSSAKIAALIGVTGLLVHGLMDFNFHIPANAALFSALCAIATVRSERDA